MAKSANSHRPESKTPLAITPENRVKLGTERYETQNERAANGLEARSPTDFRRRLLLGDVENRAPSAVPRGTDLPARRGARGEVPRARRASKAPASGDGPIVIHLPLHPDVVIHVVGPDRPPANERHDHGEKTEQ